MRHLAENYGASASLGRNILRTQAPKPRNVTATREERAAILAAAPPNLRCWILLCSDLGVRSGTSAKLGPSHYDRAAKTLTFRTKYQNAQQLPVTRELAELLEFAGSDPALPFVAQLPTGIDKRTGKPRPPILHPKSLGNAFSEVRRACGITRKLTPHDLRRTTARSVYKLTHDLRVVQAFLGHSDLTSTMWYLQDNLVEVSLQTLELAKLNSTTETIQ